MTSSASRDARERILERVRDALYDRPRDAHPGELPREAGAPAPSSGVGRLTERAATFTERFEASGGEVVRLPDDAAASAWLVDFAASFSNVALAVGLPDPLTPDLPTVAPETADLGVSLAAGAAAQTGSLLLPSHQGRGAQLLPPVHLVWVAAATICATLGEALAAERAGLPAALGLHSGPSKSADIGQILVTGVHGPGRVVAAIVG